jgi:GMP synthase-like glutamine amidotransferase
MKPIFVLQHVPHETLGSMESHFRDAGLTWRMVELFREIPRLDLREAAALVVMGGPMNVDEVQQYPFLEVEVSWIREAQALGLPTLGVCLGSQLLAKALGAKVYPNGRKEIGWYGLDLTPAAADDPLFGGLAPRQTVFQWHGDTFDLPDGAVHLASSPVCRHQAFRYGASAWGLQFHIEMTAELVCDWLDCPGGRQELATLDYIDPQAIRAGIDDGLAAMRQMGDRVLPAFARLCRAVGGE